MKLSSRHHKGNGITFDVVRKGATFNLVYGIGLGWILIKLAQEGSDQYMIVE